jgi:hypothetical protein
MSSALRGFVVGGVLGAAVMGGGALAVAQTADTTPGTSVPHADDTTPGSVPPAAGEAPAPAPDEAPAPPGAAPAPGTPAPGADCDDPDGGGAHKGGHGRGLALGHTVQELATELGVTVDQLKDAEKAARQAVQDQLGTPPRPANRPPSDEDRQKLEADMKARHELHDKVLAEKLGITVEKLHEAEANVAKKRLDEAVANGRITQQQEDEILQKLRNGEQIAPGAGLAPGMKGGPGGMGAPGGMGGPGAGPGMGRGHHGGGKGGQGSGGAPATPGTTVPGGS